MNDPSSTLHLVHRWQAGDHAAGSDLYLRLYPKLRAIAHLALGERARRDPIAADDVAHDVFLDVMTRLPEEPRFAEDQPSGFRCYMYRATRHIVVSLGRREQLREAQSLSTQQLAAELRATAAGPRTIAEVRDALAKMYGAVEAAIGKLSERDRMAIGLKFVCELSAADAADAMGGAARAPEGFKSGGQFRVTLSRALDHLRKKLTVDAAVVDQYFEALRELSR